MNASFFKFIRSTYFQMTSTILVCLYLGGLYYYEYKNTSIPEKEQTVHEVNDSIKKLSSNIAVGLYVNNFPTFSINKNEFTMQATVWFKFPVGTESLKTIEQFGFNNGKIVDKSPPYIKIIGDDVMVSYDVSVEFKTELDYSHFPMSGHRIYFTLENRSVSPHELNFIVDPAHFELDEDLLIDTWNPVNKTVSAGQQYATRYKDNPELNFSYPTVTFSIDFANNSSREIFTLYFPLFFIFFLAFFILMVDIREDLMRIEFLLIPLPLLVLDRLVIDSLSPTASVITKIDYIYFLLVFLSLIIVLFQMYSTLVLRSLRGLADNSTVKLRKLELLERCNSVVFIGVAAILVLFLTFNALT